MLICSKAYLPESDLINANLRNVNLRNADLTRANLKNADLTGAILINANLREVRLFNATGNGKEIVNVELPDFWSAYNIVYNVQTGEVWIGCFSIEIENLKYLTLEKVKKIAEKKCVNPEKTENLLYDFKNSLPILIEKLEVINSDKN